MAEDSDLERTEPASPRRLEEARNKGNIPRSRELNTFAVLVVSAMILLMTGASLIDGIAIMLQRMLQFDRTAINHDSYLWETLIEGMLEMLLLFLPFLVFLIIAVLAAPAVIGGFLLSAQAIQPDFGRLNPLKGIGRIFSVNSLVELAKGIAKSLLVGGVGFLVIWHYLNQSLSLSSQPVKIGLTHMANLLGWTFLFITLAMVLIVLIDVPFQLWDYHRKLRMTKEEVRQEHKESEGDPQLKARIRQLQRETARRRMMAEVPKADVIVTNPTHYAVALRYDEKAMRAPRVVAKGSYLLAQRIRELGEEHRIPILRTPPLARALYKHADLDQEIPAELFSAVAEVLAYVYQLHSYNKHGGLKPTAPENLQVPPGMDILETTE